MRKYTKFQYIAILTLSLLSIVLYLNSLNNSFHFDDHPNILENPYIRNLEDFSLFFRGIGSYVGIPRILTMLSFAINYHFHKFDVWGYHLVNLILHLFCSILAFLIARVLFSLELGKTTVPFEGREHPDPLKVNLLALLSALIFASHPVQVNTVTYIVQRNEGLAAFFYLFSLFLFISGSFKKGRRKFLLFLGSGGSFLCSIFSKETGFTLPLTIILFDFIFICKSKEDTVRRLKVYLPLSVIFVIYILFFLRGGIIHQLAEKSKEGIAPWHYLLTQANVIIQYFKLLLLPLPNWLNVDHDFRVSKSFIEYPTWISVSVLLLLLILAIFLIKKTRLISFSVLFFFIILAPSSSLIPLWDVMVEYRLYLPIFFYAIALSLALHFLYQLLCQYIPKRLSQILVAGISIFLLGFYSMTTIERNEIFKDEVTLWSDTAKKSPNKLRVHHNLGRAYFYRGRLDEAIREGETAISLSAHTQRKENVKFVLNLLGGAYFAKGEMPKALKMFQKAIEVDPNFATSYYNISCIYAIQHEKEKAIEYLRKGIALNPAYKEKAKKDKDFDSLRGWKEFEEVLK